MQEPLDPTPRTSEPDVALGSAHRRAFAIADELNVHGAGCVCPRCAGRLPALLTGLARAIEQADDQAGVDGRR